MVTTTRKGAVCKTANTPFTFTRHGAFWITGQWFGRHHPSLAVFPPSKDFWQRIELVSQVIKENICSKNRNWALAIYLFCVWNSNEDMFATGSLHPFNSNLWVGESCSYEWAACYKKWWMFFSFLKPTNCWNWAMFSGTTENRLHIKTVWLQGFIRSKKENAIHYFLLIGSAFVSMDCP